jgi:hypothetical protein
MNYEQALYKHFYDILKTIPNIQIIDDYTDTNNKKDYVFLQVMTLAADSVNTENSIGQMKGQFELFVQISKSIPMSKTIYTNLREQSGDLVQYVLMTLLDKRTQKQIILTSGSKEMILNVGTCKSYLEIGDVAQSTKLTGLNFVFEYNLIYN